jgi:hypothetical protein
MFLMAFVPSKPSSLRSILDEKGTTLVLRFLSFVPNIFRATPSRHYAEHSGYFEKTTFMQEARSAESDVIHFYDSNTGKLLFTAPQERSMEDFLKESRAHGWPSFRDAEVNWDFVRVLKDGETVSVDGGHLGHNLPGILLCAACVLWFISAL